MSEQTTQGGDAPQDLTVPELLPPSDGSDEQLAAVPVEVMDAGPVASMELPEDPADAVPILLTALTDAKAEAAASLDALQRLAAEFDNYRKRAVRERSEIMERASQRLIERLLPTLDGFDAALAYQPQTETEEKILAGMRDTHRLLIEALAADGFEAIPASGVPFDPAVHEAVTGPAGEGDGDLIVHELRRGYTLRGRVVRAALVSVEHA